MRKILRIVNAIVWFAWFWSSAREHLDDVGRVIGNALIPLMLGLLIDFFLRKKVSRHREGEPK